MTLQSLNTMKTKACFVSPSCKRKLFSNIAFFLWSYDMLALSPLGSAGMYSNLIQKYHSTNIFSHEQIWKVNTQQG